MTASAALRWLPAWIGGYKPPGQTPLGQNPPVSGKAGRNPQDITPVELEHNVRCHFLLQERGFWKLNSRIGGRKLPGHNPLMVYFRQSWNLAFNSAMCDSVGFILPCHWMGDSDLSGLCPPAWPVSLTMICQDYIRCVLHYFISLIICCVHCKQRHCYLQQCVTVTTALEGRRTRHWLRPRWCASVLDCFAALASVLWILRRMAFLKVSLSFTFHGMLQLLH